MKKINLIKRLWTDSHEKQSPQRFGRYAVMLLMLLTLGVGQMWAFETFKEVWLTYNIGGDDQGAAATSNQNLGNTATKFVIKAFYANCRDNWGAGRTCWQKGYLGYSTNGTNYTEVENTATTWKQDGWSEDDYQFRKESMNLTLAENSGSYSFKFYGKVTGDHDGYLNNSGSNYTWTFTILPPAVKSSSVAISATNTAPGSGTGLSSESPIILVSGMASTLTITATQNRTDANSALWCQFGTGSYSSTTTYNISSGTTQTNQTLALAVKYRNNSASLDGTETTTTIYYKWAAPAPAVVLTSVSPATSIVAGNEITLVGTRANSSNAISFQYTTDDGANWTDISPKTTSGTSPKTITWTVPDAHGETQTFKFRAKLAEATPIYSSKSSGVTVYNTKTFKLKNEKSWSDLYLYAYNGSGDLLGSFPGIHSTSSKGFSINKITNSGLWWNVTITSECTYYIISKGSGGDGNQTTNVPYGTYSDGGSYGCYNTTDGLFYTRSGGSALSAPSVSTSSVTPTVNNAATIGGNVTGLGNDLVTSYGYYYSSTNSSLSGSNLTGATKVQVGTNKNATGTYSKSQTGLTGGTTYYVIAYATNGHSTVYGSRVSFTTPKKVTPSLSTGGSSISPSTVQYTNTYIDFTAVAATGYTFSAWSKTNGDLSNAAADGSTNTVRFTPTSDNATITATYTENSYSTTVQVLPAGWGTTTPSAGSQDIKHHTGNSISASSSDVNQYIFENWSVSGGGLTMVSSASTNPNTFKATSASGTITANFTSRWTIAGSMYNNFDWSKNSNLLGSYTTEGGKVIATVTISLAANTTYTFKVKDRSQNQNTGWYGIASGSTATYTYADDNTYKDITTNSGNQNISLTTAAAGDYVFRFNLTDKKIAVDFPTSYQIRFGGYKTEYLEGADGTTQGGSMSATTSGGAVVVNDGDYVPAGATVTIDADETAGYHSVAWYNNADFAEGHKYTGLEDHVHVGTDASYIQFTSISEDKTVWLKYKENKLTLYISPSLASVEVYDVGGSVVKQTIDGLEPIYVGVHTGKKLKVIPDVPYYFTGWELAETPKYNIYKTDGSGAAPAENEDYAEVNVYATSECTSDVATQTLYANCRILNSIYFRNEKEDHTPLWDSVYVGFNATWSDESAGAAGGKKGASTKDKTVLPMEKISGNTWRVYIPRAITKAEYHNVAFFDKGKMRNWNQFYENNAVYRTDFDTRNDGILNMYVPYHVKSSTDNKTTYYNTGYWKTAYTNSVDAGYYLEHRYDNNKYTRIGTFVGTSDNKISYTLRLDNTSYKDYAIYDANGHRHIAVSGVTSTNYTDIRVRMDDTNDSRFGLTPTAEGNYVFTLDQSCDQMKLSVEFPVAVNDYVIENVYNDGRSKTTRSNVIKASDAETKTRYSMFISNAGGAATLKLRKCTEIDGSGNAVWSTGDATNLSGILSDGDFTPGVYQFDLTIDKANDRVSKVDSLRLYTGNFYIKTDAADGGWVTYKRNILDKNTVNFDRTSATYDNYFCKYFASRDCNIKSVIANDYCNQLSDTVKGDGIARMVGTEPYVPVDGTSIRFSYNSATNETKRAYLGASLANDFMNIEANATPENSVYKSDGTTNIYGASAVQRKFSDSGDWVYEMILKAKPGAKAGVTATYTDAGSTVHKQILVPIDNTLLDGTGSKKYSIRVVYDFKTNFMMSAFVLDGEEITEALSDFDMLWVRHKDDAAQEVILGDGGSMTNVRVIGAVEFKYDEMYWLSSDPSKVDLSSWTVDSRPYLKYFISFPFDVEMNSIFGLNQSYYGLDYVIQKYDGAKRAKDGLFLGDGDNYWVNMEMGDTLKANEGYCLILDNDYASGRFGRWWDNKGVGSSVYLYFPAMEEIASITATGSTVVPEHTCTIDRTWGDGGKKNHMNTDSHWNMIGSPLFCNAYIKDTTASSPYHMSSYYELNYSTNKWDAKATRSGDNKCFKAMSSRFVQWYGTIGWTNNSAESIFSAPRRVAATENYFTEIEVSYNGQSDKTYIEMIDGASNEFVLREDMMKFYNSGVPQICTFAEGYDVAYNKLPVENTTVALGLVARKNGTYTFSMPTNFSGSVTLIDKYTQTRTNLAMEDYEVYLEKGTIDDRFELEININKMPTAIDGAEDGSGSLKDGKAHKFIMNDMMYIMNDGVLYDARGNRVK